MQASDAESQSGIEVQDSTTTQRFFLDGVDSQILRAAFLVDVQFMEKLGGDEVPCGTRVDEGLR